MEHTGLFFLFTCQPTKSSKCILSGVNVRAHLLRENYSGKISSIRSGPNTFKSCENLLLYSGNMNNKIVLDLNLHLATSLKYTCILPLKQLYSCGFHRFHY